jgi:NADH-quinone oxidoreductase subunit L
MFVLEHLWIIPALPLLGAAVNGLLARNWPQSRINLTAVGTTGVAFLAALELAREFSAWWALHSLPYYKAFFPWIVAGPFRADFGLYVDQLTVVMVLVVTGVGWVIHIYSTGYMAHEGGYYRFFAYLNLFMFFMLLLVMAGNYALLFVGWEGVGLCSYLLIGFYFLRRSASDAGKKAFIVNRVGDFGFMLGMFLLFVHFGSLDYLKVFPQVAAMPAETTQAGVLTAIGLLLLAGATGKSAQIPLYTWLPDAMEGPTPVSALIHAATMVTAGVYVVARSNLIYSLAPTAMMAVALVGVITALYAATIGLVQTDIKRVLAYSTISQLGYMFLACGVGAYFAGIFHLMTHAFFKALLFLAAGSVIHALGGEQDLTRMGGLARKIPTTYFTMLAGTLAIAGAPLFSGFFSKDAILAAAATGPYGNKLYFALGLLTALLTSFYMFRLLLLTFAGPPRFDEHKVHVHESPRSMLIPLVILAIFSLIGGWQAAPEFAGGHNLFAEYLAPVFAKSDELRHAAATAQGLRLEHTTAHVWMNAGLATAVAAVGFLLAFWLYVRRPGRADELARDFHAPYRILLNKYYVDELYDAVIVRPIHWLSDRLLWQQVDVRAIDGSVNGLAHLAWLAGERVRRVQSGNARTYAAWVVLGAAAFTTFLIWLVS